MKSIEFLERPSDDHHRCVSFIIFEPSSHRIDEEDILMRGAAVRDVFDSVMAQVGRDSSLSEQVLLNRLTRISMMLDLVNSYNNVILTRFVNTIWRRYAFFSNLGELFLDLDTYKTFVPTAKLNSPSAFIKRAIDPFDFDEMLKSASEEDKDEDSEEAEADPIEASSKTSDK